MKMMKAAWLWHPESPGVQILVVRGFFSWLLLPKDFATLKEVEQYRLFMKALNGPSPN